MIKKIRTSKVSRIIACYLALMIVLEMVTPMTAYALTGGPAQPEFNSFTPIGTSDMVDLSSGDFNYNIPIMDVGGYPINLAYNSNITMDQEASWVGLGWDLNVGQIARQLRGIPDDFNGDSMVYENHMKDNITVGANFNVFGTAFGLKEAQYSVGLGVTYNNYNGLGFAVSGGMSYQISNNLSVGMNLDSKEGLSVSPSVSLSEKVKMYTNDAVGFGTNWNSRRGIEGVTMRDSRNRLGTGGSFSFPDATFTPQKRIGMISSNYLFNLNTEVEFWGIEPGIKFTGYRTKQGIMDSERYAAEKAYGYENSFNATDKDILDFNREKDRTFSTFTTTLPVGNNTYDLYSIQGQGVSGTFRPYKGQVGYAYDKNIVDISNGGTVGVEIGVGGGAHYGVDTSISITKSSTGAWRSSNPVIGRFEEKKNGNRPDYEKVFFKNIGGFHVDSEYSLLKDNMGNYDPVKVGITGGKFARATDMAFRKKDNSTVAINGPLKRDKRLARNQSIQKLTRAEAEKFGYNTQFSPYSIRGKHDYHTSEVRVIKEGGEQYIYGRAAYNVTKKEATFNIGSRMGDCNSGLVSYSPGISNSVNNKEGQDEYFNRITTPAYAHSYLLTSVLSSDYSDLTNDGPTDDDLGSYTKFVYDDSKTASDNLYKWRVPYQKNQANYDEGLKTATGDNKGNYIYGEKELLYIKKIETKTHIAIFEISARKDGYGVDGENGGATTSTSSRMYKLNKISLYSKPDYNALGENATPIKVANFKYKYTLCPGVPNNLKGAASGNEVANEGGKLTLYQIYFTYGKSNMGKYTPYTFTYASGDQNMPYSLKGYDVWGNYKLNDTEAGCGVNQNVTNAEDPYVIQDKVTADKYSGAWLLKSIKLPSGGNIDLTFESDDYRYVQNKEAMQMFKITGVGKETDATPTTLAGVTNNQLFTSTSVSDRIYIKIPETTVLNATQFKDKYIKNLQNEELFFKALLNMSPKASNAEQYDYVSGYFKIDPSRSYKLTNLISGGFYASIPVKLVNIGDGFSSSDYTNPISKAGWNFGKQNLSRYVYDGHTDESTDNLEEIVMEIIGAIPNLLEVMKSPNRQLKDNQIASKFVTGKSWVRLMNPTGKKFGGGSRVKEIKMHDNWEVMTNHAADQDYHQFYGQQYSYEDDDNPADTKPAYSTGVATYEPMGSKENPFVQPFYDKKDEAKLLGTESRNYIEMPLGESFYPSPKVTYSKVTVKNLPRTSTNGSGTPIQVKKHATGYVVTEFFTTADYPTITDYTPMTSHYDKSDVLTSLLSLSVKDHLTLSQGFSVHTNDMDGKMKSQRVYAEGQKDEISGVEYIYDQTEKLTDTDYNPNIGKLDNEVTTIDAQGNITKKLVGVDYDVINDFRDNSSVTETAGLSINTAFLPITLLTLVVPTPFPSYSIHDNRIKTATTTKVIHSSGILRAKRVFDVGSSSTTKNLAWDAETGEVLLTETANEYNDKYYTFNFPAYWSYKGMGESAKNLGLTWKLKHVTGTEGKYQFFTSNYKASDYLIDGDELWITSPDGAFKAYVVNLEDAKFGLITTDGLYVSPDVLDEGDFTVIRAGYRNMQSASMASVTSMLNPIGSGSTLATNLFSSSLWDQYRIVNTSAVVYSDTWAAQCECRLPKMNFDSNGALVFDYSNSGANKLNAYNPYIYNVKGNWRPKMSYAYLTGRNSTETASPRKTGFYNDFAPYYVYSSTTKKWEPNTPANLAKWTYASEVTQYNPFGFELENRDALNRYSSAMYGYNFKFPVAVASNTRYRELAFDGFEDYDFNSCNGTSHFSFKEELKENKVSISSTRSHTGTNSLKVAPKTRAVVRKQIVRCATTNP
ncbi:hypothetical protein [Flavobacterium sp. NRK1]|uniref:hypothetical protein n=1 Tax=Flavobacterium sp. NRK1 TaxID=2954929 RepID=UPI002092559A|nr:hypothetical protein [Flavobacterium sp. NRK1]MCO6147927.1 hypothetical protein [Flavobacterium sp. NRK1]